LPGLRGISLEHEPPCPLAAHHTRADRATPAESHTPDEQPGKPDEQPGTPDQQASTPHEQHNIDVRLRILFAAEPDDSTATRLGIDQALGAGSFAGPDGVITEWRLLDSGPAEVTADEQDHAQRLTT
jgi:hypothetical protein